MTEPETNPDPEIRGGGEGWEGEGAYARGAAAEEVAEPLKLSVRIP